jgi:hypothetical protein
MGILVTGILVATWRAPAIGTATWRLAPRAAGPVTRPT